MQKKLIFLFVILFVSSFNFVFGATVNVCSSGCAFTTIQGAVNNASNGDVINVSAGIYSESVIVNKSLTLRGAQVGIDARGRTEGGGISSIIDSGNTAGSIQIQADSVNVDGFVIRGAYKAVHVNVDSSNVIIRNIHIESASVDGINLWRAFSASAEKNFVENVGVSAITAGDDRGTGDESDDLVTRATIANNLVMNSTFGITGYQDDSIIRGNEIKEFEGAGAGIGGQFIDVLIEENIVSDYFFGAGIALQGYANRPDSRNLEIKNNTIRDNYVGVFTNQNLSGKNIKAEFNSIFGNSFAGAFNNHISLFSAENNYWGACDGPSGIANNSGDPIIGNVDFIPFLGACVENLNHDPPCVLSSNNVTLYANISSQVCIGHVIFSVYSNGNWTNYTGSPIGSSLGNYFARLNSSSLQESSNIDFQVSADDCYAHISQSNISTFRVNAITKLLINPAAPDGTNNWYISQPLFTLLNPDANSSFYEWDSAGIWNYMGQFGLENTPNNENVSGGILELNYWSNVCNETAQRKVLKADFTNPQIINLVPSSGAVLYNNLKPQISAYIDEIYQGNSGINVGSLKMYLDDVLVPAQVNDIGLDATITYTASSNLALGKHNVTISVNDEAGRISQLTWIFYLNVTGEFNLTVFTPENKNYSSKKTPFNLSASQTVEKTEYFNNNDRFPRFKVLCRNCNEYGFRKARTANLNEGWNNLTFRATNIYGFSKEKNILLFIDSKPPKILGVAPRLGAVLNGSSFLVKYTEDNLKNIFLFYEDKNISLTNCEAGNNKECSTNADLAFYNGRYINYYFKISDSNQEVQSKSTRVFVDTSSPVLNINSPLNNLTFITKKIPFNLTVSEKSTLEYYDNSELSPRWKTLCINCDEFGAKQRKSVTFRNFGMHELTIRARDKAGNIDQENLIISRDLNN